MFFQINKLLIDQLKLPQFKKVLKSHLNLTKAREV
ncbi:hypothetical protein PRO82_001187 [Candidatus Protochlamydia amoebophila]|nr:hypothetical protein [Candidatus Protochlamydia amoebophila]